MLRVAGERDMLKVKDDESISPTYACDLAKGIAGVVEGRTLRPIPPNQAGSCSWYEFTREIFRLAKSRLRSSVPGSEYPVSAARPTNGVLSSLGNPELRHWSEALADYLRREKVT